MNTNESPLPIACEPGRGVLSVESAPHGQGYKVACEPGCRTASVVIRQGREKWPLESFFYIAADITNPGPGELLIELRINEKRGMTTGSGQVIPPGETRTIRAVITRDEYPKYLDEKLYGMFALPAHPTVIKAWQGLHSGSIDRFSLTAIRPPEGAVFFVSNPRCEEPFSFLSQEELAADFFPFVDEFGQYRHKEWPGKVHSVEELKQADAEELRDLAAHPAPPKRNRFGGWLGGPQLAATGHFRTEKVDGKWWLVDPEGRLFWSHGIGLAVLFEEQSTPITEREHFFAALPDPDRFGDFYETQKWNPVGYYKDRESRVFNLYAWNVFRKRGADWKALTYRRAEARLRSWGMNTCYSWSMSTVLGLKGIPYAAMLSTRTSRRLEASEGYWGKFPDPFDPGLAAATRSELQQIPSAVSDPYFIGYFVDNEMDWGDASYLGQTVLRCAANQPAKTAALELLKSKYGTVERLNAAWGTSLAAWDEFLESTAVPDSAGEDCQAISAMLARQYFKVVRDVIREIAPDKLYMGCRFHDHFYPDENFTCDWVVKISAEYCDVISFNRYRYSAADLRLSDADKPIFVTEWHMGALDRGLFHHTLRFAQSQEHRGELYRHYLKSCLTNPFIVGALWFEYVDEPVTGRFDGENFNLGFVDICDVPYPEMVRAARSMSETMYELRSDPQTAKQENKKGDNA